MSTDFYLQSEADNGQFVSTVEKDAALRMMDKLLGINEGDNYETVVMTKKPSGDGSFIIEQVFTGEIKMLHYAGHKTEDEAFLSHYEIVRQINDGTMEYKKLRREN